MGQSPLPVHDVVMPVRPPPGVEVEPALDVDPPVPEEVLPPVPEPVDVPPVSEPVADPPLPEVAPPVAGVSVFDSSPPQPLTRPTRASVPTRAWRREVAIFGASKMRKAPIVTKGRRPYEQSPSCRSIRPLVAHLSTKAKRPLRMNRKNAPAVRAKASGSISPQRSEFFRPPRAATRVLLPSAAASEGPCPPRVVAGRGCDDRATAARRRKRRT
jgi:hypothetical protein